MSRSKHHGKGLRRPRYKPKSQGENGAIGGTCWGSTEKIRRRNRKMWSRLLGKRRRAQDKKEAQSE